MVYLTENYEISECSFFKLGMRDVYCQFIFITWKGSQEQGCQPRQTFKSLVEAVETVRWCVFTQPSWIPSDISVRGCLCIIPVRLWVFSHLASNFCPWSLWWTLYRTCEECWCGRICMREGLGFLLICICVNLDLFMPLDSAFQWLCGVIFFSP